MPHPQHVPAIDRIIDLARSLDTCTRLTTREDYFNAAEGTRILRQSERLTKGSGDYWFNEHGAVCHSEDLYYHDGYLLSPVPA